MFSTMDAKILHSEPLALSSINIYPGNTFLNLSSELTGIQTACYLERHLMLGQMSKNHAET
jgi:hypothetical protein